MPVQLVLISVIGAASWPVLVDAFNTGWRIVYDLITLAIWRILSHPSAITSVQTDFSISWSGSCFQSAAACFEMDCARKPCLQGPVAADSRGGWAAIRIPD